MKSETEASGVVITKEMEEEEKHAMEEGERKEKEMIEKVCFAFDQQAVFFPLGTEMEMVGLYP